MSISSYVEDGVFDPDTLAILAAAFDAAWDTVMRSGSPLAEPGQSEKTRERLAKRIIEMGERGERSQRRLVEDALAHLTGTQHR
jgi:hypothetical protein